jgi:hypothetical protein
LILFFEKNKKFWRFIPGSKGEINVSSPEMSSKKREGGECLENLKNI